MHTIYKQICCRREKRRTLGMYKTQYSQKLANSVSLNSYENQYIHYLTALVTRQVWIGVIFSKIVTTNSTVGRLITKADYNLDKLKKKRSTV